MGRILPQVFIFCDLSTGKSRPLVPKEFRKTVLTAFHGLGHPGQRETVRRVQKRYYWPDMGKDAASWARTCKPCQQVKVGKVIAPPTKNRPVMSPRFSDLMLDIIGPLPCSEGQSYILTILDRTSRWVDAVPMAQATAEACVKAFTRSWIKTFGLPDECTTDNGASFVSKLWTKLHDDLGTIISYTPPLHPASLGHLERMHRDIKSGLKATLLQMADKFQERWVDALPWVILSRHCAYQPHLGASPAELVLGTCPKLPGDLLAEGDGVADVEELLEKLRRNAAKTPTPTTHNRDVPTYWPKDAQRASHVYVRKGKCTPLGGKYEGPYRIINRIGDSCLNLDTGYSPSGHPRTLLAHWNNCKVGYLKEGEEPESRPNVGRPKKNIDPYNRDDK